MERLAAEALKAQRDQAVRAALKARVPMFEVAAEFDLSDAEIGDLIKSQGPPRRDDLKDARDEKKGIIVR